MTDEIAALADELYDQRQRTAPTWAHMIGEYAYADRYEDVSLAGEDAAIAEARALAARAEAVDEDGLDDADRITRSMPRPSGSTAGAGSPTTRCRAMSTSPTSSP